MAGYSGTPLIKKLGIKEGAKIIFINEPASFYKELGDMPTSIKPAPGLSGQFDYIHYFTKSKIELENFFKLILKFLKKDGCLWISWPKKSSREISDLDENVVIKTGLKAGLVDVKVAAIDDTWSGLKFVYRAKQR